MYYCLIKHKGKFKVVSAKEQVSLIDFTWIQDYNTREEANIFKHIAEIKEVKKILGITDKDISEFFGYKNKSSYYHAARRKDIEQGIINIYRLVQSKVADAKETY